MRRWLSTLLALRNLPETLERIENKINALQYDTARMRWRDLPDKGL